MRPAIQSDPKVDAEVDRRFLSGCFAVLILVFTFVLSFPVSIVSYFQVGNDRWAVALAALWVVGLVSARIVWLIGHRKASTAPTRIPRVRHATRIYATYVAFAILAIWSLGFISGRALASVPTSGPDDPTHAKTTGIPAKIRTAAETANGAGSTDLSGPIKAVRDSGTPGQNAVWIVYEQSFSGPPPPFSLFHTVAVAVDEATGQEIFGASIGQYAPYSRLGQGGAWPYLGYGLDRPSVTVIAAFLALELATLLLWAGVRRIRMGPRYNGTSVRLAGLVARIVLWLLVAAQAVAFYALGTLVSWGDPVAAVLLEVWIVALAVALVLILRLIASKPRPSLDGARSSRDEAAIATRS